MSESSPAAAPLAAGAGRKRGRGRISFASEEFADGASLRALPDAGASLRRVPVEHLAHNPRNPRYGYSDDGVKELANSLREHGQLQPATVVARDVYLAHHPDDGEVLGTASWVVLLGNRRLEAARVAGFTHLAVTVEDRLGGADPMLSEATLVENIHRQDLPPLLEARELQSLVDRHGSQVKVARRVAKSQGWVSQRLALLKLTPTLQEALRDGDLTVKEARAVAGLPADQQEAGLAKLRHDSPSDAAPQDDPAPEAADGRDSEAGREGTGTTGPNVEQIAKRLRRQLNDDELSALIDALADLRS